MEEETSNFRCCINLNNFISYPTIILLSNSSSKLEKLARIQWKQFHKYRIEYSRNYEDSQLKVCLVKGIHLLQPLFRSLVYFSFWSGFHPPKSPGSFRRSIISV